MQDTENITNILGTHGLQILGHFFVEPQDTAPENTRVLAMIGPGDEMWNTFQRSAFFEDGADDPLDRWSYHVLSGVAQEVGARALFPFGGPPYHPFIAWALRTGRIWASPVGLLVHDTAGLFVSFRGALAFAEPVEFQAVTRPKPCDTCARPCLEACPASALGPEGYDVPACKAYLAAGPTACMDAGCAVRRACPVGASLREPEQSAFHMRAFLG